MQTTRMTIACQACGAVNEEASELVDRLRLEISLRDTDLGQTHAQLQRLKADKSRQQRDALLNHPRYADAMAVLELWRSLCKPGARELASPPRLKLIYERLEAWNVDELQECVRGYARFPYVVDRQREAFGPDDCRYVEVETIFADSKRVEKGIELVKRGEVKTLPPALLASTPWRQVWAQNRTLIVNALRKEYGQPLEDDGILMFPCPRCAENCLSLRVADRPGHWLASCWLCGLSDRALLRSIVDPHLLLGDDPDLLERQIQEGAA